MTECGVGCAGNLDFPQGKERSLIQIYTDDWENYASRYDKVNFKQHTCRLEFWIPNVGLSLFLLVTSDILGASLSAMKSYDDVCIRFA